MPTPTPYEQLMLELVNQARANPGAAAQKYNFSLGNIPNKALEPLAMNENLIAAARGHSSWMERTDTFSHTGSGGSTPTQRAAAAGWDGGGVGENISGWFAFGQSDIDQQKVVEERHAGLLRSPGHLANIMNARWSEAGIGEATGDWSRGGTNYDKAFLYTQNFSDRGKSFLTGVAFDDNDGDNFYDVGEGLGGLKIEITDSSGKKVETSTWSSGGYQIALQDGSYTARFSGEGIDGVVEKKFTIAGGNVKVDLNSDNETPVADKPDAKDPDTKDPDAKKPDDKKPDDKKPDAKDPDSKKPDDKKPDDKKPDAKDPDSKKPDDKKPDDKKPDARDPDSKKPDDKKPDDKKPDAKDPDSKKPDDKKPDAKDPDAKQPDVAAGPKIENGTDGDDVFMDMAKDQIVLGGAGNDRFETKSKFDDYKFMILPNNGVLLLGEDSTKVLYDVEALKFADLSIKFNSDAPADEKPGTPDAPDMTDQPDPSKPVADNDENQMPRPTCPYLDDMMAA